MPAKPGELAITGTIRGIKPTESDLKILFGLIENLTAPIEADLDAAAKSAGLKDRNSFRVIYRLFRIKYGLPDGAKVTATAAGGSSIAEGDAIAETPIKKTVSSKKKKPAADEDFIEHEQPNTPSKSTTTTSSKKRTATGANPNETPAKKEPVKKPRITAKQKREAAAAATAIQAEAEAEAAAAAAAETTTHDATTAAGEDQQITVASSFEPISSSMFPASVTVGDAAGIDTTMEGMEEPGSEAAEALALALALEVNAAAEAEAKAEAAAVDGSAD
ncbi:hypothetical protein N0V85_003691 [Neurospora sp. IMI 360204]|nr:hypothetical protein N0V85_003691 [Neurospora sp. IMI 360204]